MSQPNLPNGVPPQMGPIERQFNGVHSSHSSRDSSPSTRLGQIPTSQLPPTQHPIPASQLPPSFAQKMGQLTVDNPQRLNSSLFSTSTPNQTVNLQKSTPGLAPSAFSPISAASLTPNLPKATPVVAPSAFSPVSTASFAPNVPKPATGSTASAFSANLTPTRSLQKPPQNSAGGAGGVASQNPVIPTSNFNHGYSNLNQAPPPNVPPNNGTQPQFGPGPNAGSGNNNGPQPQFGPGPNAGSGNNNGLQPQFGPGHNAGPGKTSVHANRYPMSPQQVQPQNRAAAPFYNQPPPQASQQPSPLQQGFQQQSSRQFQGYQQPNPQNPGYQQQNYQQTGYQQQNSNQQSFQQQNSQQQSYQQNSQQQNHTGYQPSQLYPSQQNSVPQQQGYQQQNQLYQPPNAQQQAYQQPASGAPRPVYQPNSVTHSGFNKLWGQDNVDLLQNPNVLPSDKVAPPQVYLGHQSLDSANCNPEVFRCTMTKIPESNALLQKSRLPLGVLIHPFKDLTHLPVIQCTVIVRCRACRTYINPFVSFVDTKRWKCNLCYRINELPEEFQYDPVSKTYGDPSRRPEIKSSTIEYIAPAEYMLRPPQPAVYLFLFDVSRLAVESGYLTSACSVLLEELKNLPGDARTQLGIIAYDSSLHFFSLGDGLSQPHEMTVLEIDDIFLPCPDNLLINLKDRMDLLVDLLTQLPMRYNNNYDNNSALGAALQAAHKMMGATGGRVTVFQCSLPNVGPGALASREEPSQRASSEVAHLNPANDFYKRLALECSGQQIAVDLFIVNSQYVDIATISGVSRFSGGCIHHFPLFKATRVLQNERFERCFRRYLTRKIGFEAVMRLRCSRGLSIHTFHGNFFVRSTDLLSLPNVNPDAGFGMQVSIDDNLSDVQSICFQAALLYTSSKGERRIRVHTMCLPICSTLADVINSADQQCIVGLLGKMAVDRSMQSSLSDAREAFINVAIDILSSYKLSLNMGNGTSGLLAPQCLRLLPLYISALLKYVSFRTGTSTRLDDRVKAMIDMKTKPLPQLIQAIYPDLYPVHDLDEQPVILNVDEEPVPQPPHLQLSARFLNVKGAFLMDLGEHMILLVSPGVSQVFLNQVLGVLNYVSITDEMCELPVLDNLHNQRLHQFISYLNEEKPFVATLQIIRDNSPHRIEFFERLIEDRVENALSYHEFLQHLKTQIK